MKILEIDFSHPERGPALELDVAYPMRGSVEIFLPLEYLNINNKLIEII